MYTTIEQVQELTEQEVSLDDVARAQAIIEAYTGKPEALVDSARDMALLGQATAYQAAYMHMNDDVVFQQVAVKQIGIAGSIYTFKDGDYAAPWVAPLAVIACKNLSWMRPRSVRTGTIFGRPHADNWWTD